jgi:hypothetical protein
MYISYDSSQSVSWLGPILHLQELGCQDPWIWVDASKDVNPSNVKSGSFLLIPFQFKSDYSRKRYTQLARYKSWSVASPYSVSRGEHEDTCFKFGSLSVVFMEYSPSPLEHDTSSSKFFLNPLECLLPSDTVSPTGTEFVKPGTPAGLMIRRITNNILTYESSSMSRTRAYSPSFRCCTGLPFYASLLRELKSLVNEIDYQPNPIRGLVWAQLFVIVGTQQTYDGAFGPVLRDTMSQPTVNLLDMEVLLISFFLIINRFPQILDGDLTDVPLEPSEAQREELERQSQLFFAQFRTRPAFVSSPLIRNTQGIPDPAQALLQRARAVCTLC